MDRRLFTPGGASGMFRSAADDRPVAAHTVTLVEVGGLGIADPAYVGRLRTARVKMATGGRSERGRQVGHDRAGGR